MKHKLVTVLVGLFLVNSCTTGGDPIAGIDRGGIVVGPVTGFGSIIVNGVRYGTESASVTVNGEPGLVADLEVGHLVTVQVTYTDAGTTPIADSINFENIVEGPISGISISNDQFVVLGQLVHSVSATSYASEIDPPAIGSLTVDQVVKVSGFVRSDGSIQATRIESGQIGQPMVIIGIVRNPDDMQQTFSIGDLRIDYKTLALNVQPAEGDRIRVTGTQLGTLGELLATEISPRQQALDTSEGDEAEVEGLITNFISPAQFTIGGIGISTDPDNTEFEGGNDSGLMENIRIEVEGRFDANGILVAKRVEFRQNGDLGLSAPIDGIVQNELTMLGILVEVNGLTSFEDKSPLELKNFGLPDLNSTDYINIKGYESKLTPGVLVAVSLERIQSETTVKARGIAENVVNPTLSILGVAVATDANTQYQSAADLPIDAATFYATAEGRLVEAKGALISGMILADKIEFEN